MTLGKIERLNAAGMASKVLLRMILTEPDREIDGWCVDGRWPLSKNQPAEITMFQISEVQEAPAFNGRRSSLTLRVRNTQRSQVYIPYMSPHNYADCVGNYCVAVLSGEIVAACWHSSG